MHVDTSMYTMSPKYNVASIDDVTMYMKINFIKEKRDSRGGDMAYRGGRKGNGKEIEGSVL